MDAMIEARATLAAASALGPSGLPLVTATGAELRRQLDSVNQLRDQKKREAQRVGRLQLQIDQLREEAARADENFRAADERLQALQIQKQYGKLGRISVPNPADTPLPPSSDRRIPLAWVQTVTEPLPPQATPWAIPGLTVYELPMPARTYVIGVDPAEGTPHSDDSAACVVAGDTWGEVATLAGKLEPGAFARLVAQVAAVYADAGVMVERNNHGHAVIRALLEEGATVLDGYDGRPGWLTNIKGKPLLYDLTTQAIRDAACRVRAPETAAQLASLSANTLAAPAGLHDDPPDPIAQAIAALAAGASRGDASTVAPAPDPLADLESISW